MMQKARPILCLFLSCLFTAHATRGFTSSSVGDVDQGRDAVTAGGSLSEKEPLVYVRHLMSTDPLGSYPGPPKITKPFDIRGIIGLPITESFPPSYSSTTAPASSPLHDTKVPAYVSEPITKLPPPKKADVKPSGRGCVCDPLPKHVCGVDGTTYLNACWAKCAGIKIDSNIACSDPK